MKTQSLALTLTALAVVMNGCAMQQPSPETAQVVIQSLKTSQLAEKPTTDNPANKPWRLGVLWLPGGMGGSAILSPGYEHVVRRNAIFPVQNEPASDAEVAVMPSQDYPSPYAPDAESVKVGKPRFCRPCRQAKLKSHSGKATRHKRTVSHRPATPCRANQGGK
jgi:hypothetical protein